MLFKSASKITFRTCGTKIFKPDELHVTRVYSNDVVILMNSGILRFTEDGKDIELKAGEYYIQRAGLLQEGKRLSELAEYFYIELIGGEYEESCVGIPLRGSFNAASISIYQKRLEEAYLTHKATQFLLNGYMNLILCELTSDETKIESQEQTARLIRNDLRARYTEKISINELSERYGYDGDHIIRIFKKYYGKTPHKYLIELKIEHACWLLVNTDLSAAAIADSVGYGDFPTFWRSFKSACGVSPTQYRNHVIKE